MSYGDSHLQYLQGTTRSLTIVNTTPATAIDASRRRLWRIEGIGVTRKYSKDIDLQMEAAILPSADLLMGLYGGAVPVAFLVRGRQQHISLEMGTYLPNNFAFPPDKATQIVSDRAQVVKALLQSTFRGIRLKASDPRIETPKSSGLVIGIPSTKPMDNTDKLLPLDRLARALRGVDWGVLVLASPMNRKQLGELRLKAVEEAKAVRFFNEKQPMKDLLGAYYGEFMEATVRDYTYGLALGGWRTSVYLFGDESVCARLGAVWQGVFSGDSSVPMPIRFGRSEELPRFTTDWAVSDQSNGDGPGIFRHEFMHQTILTSAQLAAYIHLPREELNGFSIDLVPRFDSMPPPRPEKRPLLIGNVMLDRRETAVSYSMPLDSLRSHAFITGITNSGKTNTVKGLLLQAAAAGIPFLVIEPAKAEYRALLGATLDKPIYIFTAGNERVSPLRFNPFEPIKGTSVSVHLDLLRSAFNASMGMWNPLPQVLEQCLHAVYRDRGWDLASDMNERGAARDSKMAFPTLSDLLRKVDEVTPQLGYDREIEANIRAGLRTRLGSLCAGGKGRMLDVRTSTPSEILYGECVVLELEELGDDDDKAFIMALMLIRSWEYLRQFGETSELRHLLVIEEAHRLLTNVANKSGEEGNPRAKAVEGFTNLLSEIRAFGQGIVIADQVASRLAPDVIKNTNLKIAHRVVALDDRQILAGSMAMTDEQSLIVSTLLVGEAAVYAEGNDSPLLIKMPDVRKALGASLPDVDVVISKMEALLPVTERHWGCVASLESQNACELARQLAESEAFQQELLRIVLANLEAHSDDASEGWQSLQSFLLAAQRPGINAAVLNQCTFARAALLFADRWGAHVGWPYDNVNRVATLTRTALVALSEGKSDSLQPLVYALQQLNVRSYSPYKACDAICSVQPPTCMFRGAAKVLVGQSIWRGAWNAATSEDVAKQAGTRESSWEVALDAATLLVGSRSSSVARRAGLCFSQLMLHADTDRIPAMRDVAMQALFRASNASEGDST